MKTLITGASGQLGLELQRTAPFDFQPVTLDREALDITDAAAVEKALDVHRPKLIINAAAYTAVDQAEQEREQAAAVNALAPGLLAQAATRAGIRLIHVSTDFVFDGAQGRPYAPADTPNPLGVYGATKLEGERRVLEATAGRALIVRTGWVYSAHGDNFVKTMLRLMRERDQLGVVADQIGTPTWARGLAQAIWKFAAQEALEGVYHWSDAGAASWYDFAVAIQEEALSIGLLDRAIPVRPIRSEDYPTPVKRPAYSVLDKSSSWAALENEPVHWRAALREMLRELN